MKTPWLMYWAFVGFLLTGCSAHSPFIVRNTVDSAPVSPGTYAAHHEQVFVTEEPLPAGIEFEVVSTIDVGRIWYGSSGNVLLSMANRARELGANAVVQVKTWRQPSGFSWAAPHGSGQAVRVKDAKALHERGMKGDWY